MTGIYGNHPEDRARERELNKHLDSTCAEFERAFAAEFDKLLADPVDAATTIGDEAFWLIGMTDEQVRTQQERFAAFGVEAKVRAKLAQRQRELAFVAALVSLIKRADRGEPMTEDERAVAEHCLHIARAAAEERAEDAITEGRYPDAADRADAEDAAYEDHKQRQLDNAA